RHYICFFFQAEDGIRDWSVTGVQTCALPIFLQYVVVSPANVLQEQHRIKEESQDCQLDLHLQLPGNERGHGGVERVADGKKRLEIGRASCRERVESSEGAG